MGSADGRKVKVEGNAADTVADACVMITRYLLLSRRSRHAIIVTRRYCFTTRVRGLRGARRTPEERVGCENPTGGGAPIRERRAAAAVINTTRRRVFAAAEHGVGPPRRACRTHRRRTPPPVPDPRYASTGQPRRH